MPNALNADEGRVYGTASIYVAPVGTTAPTDITTALNASFKLLGYTVPDGVVWGKSTDVFSVNAHQSFYPIKRGITSLEFTVKFVMEQMNNDTFKLYWGGGSFAVAGGASTYTPPAAGTVDYRALVVQGLDDVGKTFRLHCPKGLCTEFEDITFVKDNTSNLGVTYSLTPTGVGNPWTFISDDTTAFPAG